jgi:AhpD family alkylhydroperoxidase
MQARITTRITTRITNPVVTIPGAMQAAMALGEAAKRGGGLPPIMRSLIHLRTSQINGCSYCVDMHSRELKKAGETDKCVFAVPAWREAPYFTEAEHAALALTEAATRLSDRPDPVPDDVWDAAALHLDESAIAATLLEVATTNFWNRLTVATRQMPGAGAH